MNQEFLNYEFQVRRMRKNSLVQRKAVPPVYQEYCEIIRGKLWPITRNLRLIARLKLAIG